MKKKQEIESTADDPKTGKAETRQGHGSGEAATLGGRSGKAFIRDGDEMEAWSRGGGGVDRRRQKRRRSGQGGGGAVKAEAEAEGEACVDQRRRLGPVSCRPSVLLREPRHGPTVGPGRHGHEH
uniref:Uncharacterized protein n=1 Tax=Oryza sativa subsp. japonica TaxID=39947 RepID=Q652S2_ORYSJ|nr:hypothetical protein [Oryza sativa Japonica Group]